ncbi:MAG: FmdE family protein [Cloacibacillus sp.]
MTSDKKELYNKCISFHGHSCGGLMIGFRAALCAMELLGIEEPSCDEEIVCIAENDACGVDAVQALLGCTAGKGNLIFRLRGKQAFTIFGRRQNKSFRLVLKERAFASKEEKLRFMMEAPSSEIFEVKTPAFECPPKAEIYSSFPCGSCGERTAEPWLRAKNGKMLCLDCCKK